MIDEKQVVALGLATYKIWRYHPGVSRKILAVDNSYGGIHCMFSQSANCLQSRSAVADNNVIKSFCHTKNPILKGKESAKMRTPQFIKQRI